MSEPSWLCDDPIDLKRMDQFGVDELVDRLVGLLNGARAPFTVSLSGAWGVGKSTIADAVVARLQLRHVRAVKIDTWTQDVSQLRRSIVIEVGGALKGGADARKRVAEELDEARATRIEVQSARVELRGIRETGRLLYRHWSALLVAAAVLGFAMYEAAHLDKDSGLRPIFITIASTMAAILLTSAVFRLVTPSTSRAPASEEFALAEKFAEIVAKHPRCLGYKGPVVAVIDNLDRLSGADALMALGQIRAIVEIEGSRCVFFVPIDRTRLAEHLGRQLSDPRAAADYLEKFFNLDLQLAPPEPVDLHDWAFQQARKLFPAVEDPDLRSVAEITVSAADGSPRRVIRLLNGVFTRDRILGQTDNLGLRQLALMEGVATIAPELVDALAAGPRAFVEARDDFDRQADAKSQARVLSQFLSERGGRTIRQHKQDIADGSVTSVDHDRLRVFLAANQNIQITPEQVRLALTLRPDRFWKGLTEADLVQDALRTGDGEAVSAYLEGRSEPDQDLVLDRAVHLVERSAGFTRVVARALDAIAAHVQNKPSLDARLYRAAAGTLADADVELLRSLTSSSTEYLFTRGRDDQRQPQLRLRLVEAIADTTSTLPVTSLVVGVRSIADLLDAPELDRLRGRLAVANLEEQAPLFAEPPCRRLAEGAVVAAMFEHLGSWNPAATGQEQVVVIAERLVALSNTGSVGEPLLAGLASKLSALVPDLTDRPDVLASFAALTRLLALATPGPEIDQLGSQLATKRSVGEKELFTYALVLPLQDAAIAAIGTEIQSWMRSATPAQIESLLSERRALVEAALPSCSQVLLDLWASKGDQQYAVLAVGGSPDRLGRLHLAWDALPSAGAITRVIDAFELTASVGGRQGVEALADRLALRVSTLQYDELSALPSVATWLVKHKASRQSLVDALGAKIRAATGSADLQAIAPPVIETATKFGGRQSDSLAEALADGFIAKNCGEPEHVEWVVKHLAAQSMRERLWVKTIERGVPLEPTLRAAANPENQFGSAQVFEAMIQLANQQTEESDASRVLDGAIGWLPSALSDDSDARAGLDALASKHAGLSDRVDQLGRLISGLE